MVSKNCKSNIYEKYKFNRYNKCNTNIYIWSKTGYTLLGWNTYKEATEAKHPVTSGVAQYWIESNSPETTLYAVWSPNTNTAYKVVHQQMNVNGSGYTTVLTEPLTGTTGASVTPAVKSYTGFTSPSTQTVTIAADGSTTVTYKYARRKFKFTLGTGTGVSTSGSTASGEYYYGATINLKATASTGYTWSKWTSSNTGLVANTTTANTTFAMPAGAVTMTPSAAAKTVKVIFMRNTSSTDTTKAEQTFTYGVTGQSFSNKGWSRSGYTLLGWDFDKNATTQRYSVTNGVIDSWIANNSPSVTLYAIWKVNHTHVASCYHSHTDSCYNITYHSHSNSCYSYTYHSHSNSCYKYTYHSHSSSCYHSHSSSCYSSCSGGTVGVSSSSTSTCSSCGNKSYTTNVMKCSKCSATSTFKGCSRCGSGPVGSFSHSRILSCTKSTSSATCGKTTSTVESSTLTCGKTTSTVASSTLTCGKSTSTIESKSLKCTTSTSTPLCGY